MFTTLGNDAKEATFLLFKTSGNDAKEATLFVKILLKFTVWIVIFCHVIALKFIYEL